jgi:mono/diheme cytochrome c family protein
MQRFFTSAASLAGFALTLNLTTPAMADEPGGVTKLKPPVTGEEVYQQVCQACHMPDGRGGSGAATIPALANNPRLAASAYPITMVVKGRGAMPGFTDLLQPPQIANVVGYIRTHFGNSYAKPVTTAEVAQMEGAPGR